MDPSRLTLWTGTMYTHLVPWTKEQDERVASTDKTLCSLKPLWLGMIPLLSF